MADGRIDGDGVRCAAAAQTVYPAPAAGAPDDAALPPPIELVGCDADLLAVLLDEAGVADSALQARRLLAASGGLAALGSCSSTTLALRHGLPARAATRIAAAFELSRRAATAPGTARPCVRSPAQAAALLEPQLSGLAQEQLRVLLLDTGLRLIANLMVYQGTVDTCVVRAAELLRDAVRSNAHAVLLAHNHPSGSTEPSPDDLALTRTVIDAGRLLDIAVVDHVIIGRGSHLSLRAARLVAGGW